MLNLSPMRPRGSTELVHEEAYLLFPKLFQFVLKAVDTFTINICLIQLVPAVNNTFGEENKNFLKSRLILCLTIFHVWPRVLCWFSISKKKRFEWYSRKTTYHLVNFQKICSVSSLFGRPLGRLWYPMSSVVVCPSVTFCIVAKRHILAKNCLKEQIG